MAIEEPITLRPVGFDVEKAPEGKGFVLVLRCLKCDEAQTIVTIRLTCPLWWAQVIDLIADRVFNVLNGKH